MVVSLVVGPSGTEGKLIGPEWYTFLHRRFLPTKTPKNLEEFGCVSLLLDQVLEKCGRRGELG